MSDTANLRLPLLDASQAQKHVSVNDGLLRLDALVQAGAVSATTMAQPASPVDGDLYILPPGKTGADWGSAADGALAHYRDGAWMFYGARKGWLVFVRDTDRLLYYSGTAWSAALADLLVALGTSGLVARTGAGAYAARTIQGTSDKIAVADGDGAAGDPILTLPDPVSLGTARFAPGSAAAPGLSPSGDTNTGLFAPAADTIALAAGGVEVWRANAAGETRAVRLGRRLREPATLWPGMRASMTRATLGASLSGSTKWIGGVLGPNEKIYGIPYNAADILIIDPVAGTASRSALGASLGDASKWQGGVLGPDGRIYGLPANASDILIIDPAAGAASRSALGASLGGLTQWIGGVLGPDGKIYGIPYNAADILIIDPIAGTASRSALGASLGDAGKWCGGVLGPDGKIYGLPHNATDILIIDPAAGTASRSTLGASLSGSTKWYGGALGPDGKVYGVPYSAADILIIDPVAGTASRSALGTSLSDAGKWSGGVLGPDGKIYGMPASATDILIIDPIAGAASRSALGASLSGSTKWLGGVLASNGAIYGIPRDAADILCSNRFPSPYPAATCLSPFLNAL